VPDQITVTIRLNGGERAFHVPPGRRLLDLIRFDAGLTGTKEGCGAGECGACTVLLDGEPVTSCLVLAASCEGHQVQTIEHLAATNHPLVATMAEAGGVQCGFCTPGIIVTGAALLANGVPERSEAARCLSGNLCRCTGYHKIFDAIERAADDGEERS
jgi:aerobic-type carbon monoxide dehydrogenase small subunit (CoxS/CutS family)